MAYNIFTCVLIVTLFLRLDGFISPTCLKSSCPLSRRLHVLHVLNRETIQFDSDKVESLWAWVSAAFAGDPRYNNLMLAFSCIFGQHEPGSEADILVRTARDNCDMDEGLLVGDPYR